MTFLSDYRVIDVTDERGLLAGHMFAHLGCPGHPGRAARRVAQRGEHHGCHRMVLSPGRRMLAGKNSVVLNRTTEAGRNIYICLVETADFLFESETPGVLAVEGFLPRAW